MKQQRRKMPPARSPRHSRRTGRAKKTAVAAVRKRAGRPPQARASEPPARPRPAGWIAARKVPISVALQSKLAPDQIKIGERHRQNVGDVRALALDLNERGLLHPVVVNVAHELIAGARRLLAWQHPDHIRRGESIPVHVVPLADLVAGEWAENDPALRKDFTPSEAVAIKRVIEQKLKPAAAARMRAGKKPPGAAGNAGDRAASFTGKSRRTIEKAEAVVAAADAEPEKFGKLKADMDKSGRVDGPFKRLQTMKAAEAIRREPPPLPGNGPYRAAVIDFPWAAEPDEDDPERLARGYYPYPTMSAAQIEAYCREQIAGLLHRDCVVGLWITNYHLARGDHVAVIAALGLDPVTIRTWVKDRMGRGQVLRGQTEHCIIAKRGKPTLLVDNLTTFFHAAIDKERHSLKPQKFYSDFERLIPAQRYASFFETTARGDKWDGHGDKAPALSDQQRLAGDEQGEAS